ncbi:pentapeptide repeat-containing protein [Actinoplanes palleronii]|uniref:pentapeptide repeat-containing protein n=1 Tax=Actinoplanes palleronii TaxID=113570 RepID=UPI001EF19179|nr:pentapeptide repeat-containing protein [Actinoplanes palleronii]
MTEDPGPLPPDAAPPERTDHDPAATGNPAGRTAEGPGTAPTITPRTAGVPSDRRWFDGVLWLWPLVVLGLLALASQLFGAFGVTAAGIAAVATIVMVVGGATFERPTKVAVLAVSTGLIGVAFVGWQMKVLPDEPVRTAAAVASVRPSATPSSPAELVAMLNSGWGAGADLRSADLTGQSITNAALDGAHASGITLIRAILDGGSLAGADLSGAKMAGVQLRGADLRGAVLAGADLPKGILTDACLAGANLTGADLTGANLTGAVVSGVHIDGPAARAIIGWNTPSESGRAACG